MRDGTGASRLSPTDWLELQFQGLKVEIPWDSTPDVGVGFLKWDTRRQVHVLCPEQSCQD